MICACVILPLMPMCFSFRPKAVVRRMADERKPELRLNRRHEDKR